MANFAESLAGQGHDARTVRVAWEGHFRSLGWVVHRDFPVFIPPLQKHSRLALYVSHPLRLGLMFDVKKARVESIMALQQFDGVRVIVLRETTRAPYAAGVDLVLPCFTRPLPRNAAELATPAFLAFVKEHPSDYYRDGVDPDHVAWKCEKACREQGALFTKRRLLAWLKNEYPKGGSLAKPRCKVCQTRFVAKDGERCLDCKYKPR